ncbi:techylectin-5B-like [Lissotriton helveticus]
MVVPVTTAVVLEEAAAGTISAGITGITGVGEAATDSAAAALLARVALGTFFGAILSRNPRCEAPEQGARPNRAGTSGGRQRRGCSPDKPSTDPQTNHGIVCLTLRSELWTNHSHSIRRALVCRGREKQKQPGVTANSHKTSGPRSADQGQNIDVKNIVNQNINLKVLLVFVIVWQFDLSLESACKTSSDKNAWKQIIKKRNVVEPPPLDCSDIHPRVEHSGVYVIYPAGPQAPVPVFCAITTDGGPWTVFQKRLNGSLDFYRRWHDYRHGFGQADGEYWLGLQYIHLLTLQRKYELRIDLEDFEGNTASASYAEFSVSPGAINAALDGYTLHVAGFRDGGAGDSLTPHSGAKFSTLDRDRDMHVQHCAQYARGAFWYHDEGCVTTNLNGRYLGPRPKSALEIGFNWYSWRGPDYSLKRSEMKIRPVTAINGKALA